MKVLHIIWDTGQGGAQSYLYGLLQQHQASGKVTSEGLVLSRGGPLSDRIEDLGVPINHIGMRSGYDLVGILKLYRWLRQTNHDIIHSHSANLALNWMLRKIPGPKIYTEHGGSLLGGRWKARLIYKIFQSNYRRFIAISRAMAEVMEAANPKVAERIRVVYNGVNQREIEATTPHEGEGLPFDIVAKRFRVGIVGRLVHQKGLSTFLETAAVLGQTSEDIIFPVIGDGPLRSELEAQAKHLGIEDKVFFLGFRLDARQILKLFDVFLFTSNYEPFGLVLTEAMAAGVPVVALNLKGGVREIVEDGINGFVVDQKVPALLAERVSRLLNNDPLRENFKRNGRRKVEERFTIEHNAKQVLDVYHECLHEG